MESHEFKVLIIGAGSTGLLLAQGLKTAGTRYEVYERDTSDRFIVSSREWGMSMHWGGDFLANALPPELVARLNEIDCDPYYDHSKDSGFVQCNGKTGEVIMVIPGTMPRRVSRRKLRALLATGIDIQLNKNITVIHTDSAGVTATFEDGSTATGSILIGCDGSKSRVRAAMIGGQKSELSDAGITLINFTTTYTAEQARHLRMIHPVFKASYHPDLNDIYLLAIIDVPDPEKPETWKYQNIMGWQGPPYKEDLQDASARIKHFKERGAQYAEPWRTAALSVSDDTIIPVDRGQYLMPQRRVDGDRRITLAGDAAHPMLPYRGQGLNHALQDAAHLVEALKAVHAKEKTLDAAISAYEEEMYERSGQEVQISLKQAMMSHDYSKLMQSPMFKIGTHKPNAKAAREKETAGVAPSGTAQ